MTIQTVLPTGTLLEPANQENPTSALTHHILLEGQSVCTSNCLIFLFLFEIQASTFNAVFSRVFWCFVVFWVFLGRKKASLSDWVISLGSFFLLESRTSKQVLPLCLEGKWSPSTGKTQPLTAQKQITSTASGRVQHAGIKASRSKNTYCTFFQVAFGK